MDNKKSNGMTETKFKKLPHSEVEITGEIPADVFESYRKKAISELSENFELPGFRKGKVPENMFLQKVPDMVILEEMAEMAIAEAYPKLIEEHKIDPIGRPSVSLTKIAKDNPLGFVIKTAVIPEVKLADYKKIGEKISKEKEDVLITDEELDKAVEEIRKMRAPKLDSQPITDDKKENPIPEPILPELNDEFVKTLGKFENVTEFKNKLRENLKIEKKRGAKEKKRIKILDELVEKSEIDLPEIIIAEEQNRLIYQLKYDVERIGMKFEDYLKNVSKTEDDIKTEWKSEAEKRAKIEILISKIAEEEKISPTEEELSTEVKHLLEHNKDVDESRARAYLTQVITNQKVMEFLEKQETKE